MNLILYLLIILQLAKSEDDIFLGVEQKTGYVKLNENDKVFYWSFPCTNKKLKSPIVFWLSGGPGCSSELSVFFENGPYKIIPGTEKLRLNPYSWNKLSDIVFVDFPGGTGFSIFDNEKFFQYTETDVAIEFENFLNGFLEDNGYDKDAEFYVTGESYAGKYIPAIAHYLSDRGYKGLKGVAIGDGFTDPKENQKHQAKFLYKHNVINKKAYQDSFQYLWDCIDETKKEYLGNDGDKYCNNYFNYLVNSAEYNFNVYNINYLCEGPLCYDLKPISKFLNNKKVQKAIGVDRKWKTCNNTVYYQFMNDFNKPQVNHLGEALNNGVKVLVYNGDQDFMCNWVEANKWTQKMHWKYQFEFKQQKFINWIKADKRRGLYKKYKNLVFMKVLNAGHLVPHDQPISALHILEELIYTWFK